MMFLPVLASIAIVTNGVTCSRIQMHRKASHVEIRAATELQKVLKTMSGAHVPYTISPGGEYILGPYRSAEIVLVTEQWGRDLLPKKALDKLAATTNPDAFVICSRENRGAGQAICIAGKNPIGVYYGVYAFLEDYLGCGFYHAQSDGTVIPKTKTIEVAEDVFDFREPWIKYRRMSCWSGACKPIPILDMFAWQAKRSFQWWLDGSLRGRMDFGEGALTFSELANLPFNCGGEPFTCQAIPESMFKDHPEYFTLIKGKRVAGKYPARRCYSNPDVKRLCIELGIAFADYGGEVAVQMTDKPGGWCECEECKKYGMDEKGVWSSQNYGHRFMGEIAAGILAARPNADVVVDSYLQWREIPTCDFPHDQRAKCVYAPHQRCYAHALNDQDADCNRHFNELYRDWLKIYPRNGIFDYYCYAQTEYAPIEYVFAEDMKHYRANGLEHFVEDTSNGSIVESYPYNNWPFYYILSKFVWNPDLDVEKELDKAYRRYYGKAAEPMIRYHALRRQLWESVSEHIGMGIGSSLRQGRCLLTEGATEQLLAYLDEAAALAKGDNDLVSRVGRDRKCLEGIWIMRRDKLLKGGATMDQRIVPVGRVGAARPIVIDGVPNEKGWRDTPFLSGFRTADGKKPKAFTAVRAVTDATGLAFSVEAYAPAAKQVGDTVTIALVHNENSKVFTIATNGEATSRRFDEECKIISYPDRYAAELRVPYSSLGASGVQTGDDWLIQVERKTSDGEVATLDGVPLAETARYRRAAFGHNVVVDGFFSERKGNFLVRYGSDRPKLVTNDLGRVSVRLEKGAIVYGLPLLEIPYGTKKPTHVHGAITASGTNSVTVVIPYFTMDPAGTGKRIPGNVRVGSLPVPPTRKAIKFEADIPAGARPSIHVYGSGVTIDGIEITRD